MTQRGADDVRALEAEAIMLCLIGRYCDVTFISHIFLAWNLCETMSNSAKNNSKTDDDDEWLSNVVEETHLDRQFLTN